METLKEYYQKQLLLNIGKSFTLVFNGCNIPVSLESTYDSISNYYFNNVNLNQFEGWR